MRNIPPCSYRSSRKRTRPSISIERLARHDESQKILIHDIKHHLQAIDDLSDSQSCEKIHTYVQNLLRTSYQDQVKVSDNHFLNLILSRYIQLCRDQNIAFETGHSCRASGVFGLPGYDSSFYQSAGQCSGLCQ